MAAGMNFTARSLSNAALSSKSSHFSVTTKLFLQHHKTPYCCWSVDTPSTIRASRRAQVNLHRNMSVVWKIEFVGQQRTTVKLTRDATDEIACQPHSLIYANVCIRARNTTVSPPMQLACLLIGTGWQLIVGTVYTLRILCSRLSP